MFGSNWSWEQHQAGSPHTVGSGTRDRELGKQVFYLEDNCSFSCHFVAAMYFPANYVSGPKVTHDTQDKQENVSWMSWIGHEFHLANTHNYKMTVPRPTHPSCVTHPSLFGLYIASTGRKQEVRGHSPPLYSLVRQLQHHTYYINHIEHTYKWH